MNEQGLEWFNAQYDQVMMFSLSKSDPSGDNKQLYALVFIVLLGDSASEHDAILEELSTMVASQIWKCRKTTGEMLRCEHPKVTTNGTVCATGLTEQRESGAWSLHHRRVSHCADELSSRRKYDDNQGSFASFTVIADMPKWNHD